MNDSFLGDERLVDLLIQRATTGVAPGEAAELERRLAMYPDADVASIEGTVVALSLAARSAEAPLPPGLRTRMIAQEAAWRGRGSVINLAERTRRADPLSGTSNRVTPPGRAVGWWAAAAAIVLAVVGWYPRLHGAPAEADPGQRRAQLLAGTAGLVRWSFAPTDDPAGRRVTGDVVWDPVSQHGFLRLQGLSANDARQSQYQLWIFDRERDERFPVDGGVFNIPAGRSEVIIPFVARLHVTQPTLFAVTVERPGGVVVSAREHLAGVAKPANS